MRLERWANSSIWPSGGCVAGFGNLALGLILLVLCLALSLLVLGLMLNRVCFSGICGGLDSMIVQRRLGVVRSGRAGFGVFRPRLASLRSSFTSLLSPSFNSDNVYTNFGIHAHPHLAYRCPHGFAGFLVGVVVGAAHLDHWLIKGRALQAFGYWVGFDGVKKSIKLFEEVGVRRGEAHG